MRNREGPDALNREDVRTEVAEDALSGILAYGVLDLRRRQSRVGCAERRANPGDMRRSLIPWVSTEWLPGSRPKYYSPLRSRKGLR